MALDRIADSPLLFRARRVLDAQELTAVLALVSDAETLALRHISTARGPEGESLELPVEDDPLLESVRDRVLALLRLPEADLGTLRFRRTRPGQGHPPHLDDYTMGGRRLVATVLIGIERAEAGGETVFTDGPEGPLAERIEPGDALVWANVFPDGRPDPTTRHRGAPVRAGVKSTLGCFLYDHPAALEGSALSRPPPPHVERFYCIDAGVPSEIRSALRAACVARRVDYQPLDPHVFDFSDPAELEPGAMLFTPATSPGAIHLEQHLAGPAVATLYADAEGPLRLHENQLLSLQRAGLPVPRSIFHLEPDAERLARYVAWLGGWPVVLKIGGYSHGIGVVRADTLPGLVSSVELMVARGLSPTLQAWVEDALHWRLVVVGDAVVAAYRNRTRPDDFRSEASEDVADYGAEPGAELERLALRACAALGLEHGGVDLLVHPSGRAYVLEVNFPCYFGHAQLEGGVDVAGHLVDHLRAKAESLRGGE